MFEQLPATNSHKSKRKLRAFAGAFALQLTLVAALIVAQMAMPEKLGQFQLLQTLYMAPPPPPPPAPVSAAPEPIRRAQPKAAATNRPAPAVEELPRAIEPPEREPEVIAPTAIPQDIARIVESGGGVAASNSGGVPGGVAGGIPGGVTGGLPGGVLGGVLGGVAAEPVKMEKPKEPVRVGGNVKPPKLVHIEQPTYPPAAKRAKVEGVVVVEAVVTEDGRVDKVKVISGNPLLTDAAVDAIQKWRYEPTILNGQAVPVVLTARISFSMDNAGK